ncbi:MAG: S8 family serine peptidase [Bacteroidales bacterium]
MKRYNLLLLFALLSIFTNEIYADDFYRVWLKDKEGSVCNISRPETFLSESAIARRNKQGYAINENDLPVSAVYLQQLSEKGEIITQSKWMNTVVLKFKNYKDYETLKEFAFIDSLKWIGNYDGSKPSKRKNNLRGEHHARNLNAKEVANLHKNSVEQITLLKGDKLHESGYRGRGMKVAILDAGFPSWDKIASINSDQVIEYKDFSYPKVKHFGDEKHGTNVLSILLADTDDSIQGTAPEAEYYLFKTENTLYELPVEEDFWISALEYADSTGIDIINSSLGYHTFDITSLNHTKSNVDGQSSFISQAAQKAIERGMFLVISAGNDGLTEWAKIGFPADTKNALTVGSIDRKGEVSNFSSRGFVLGNYVKPDVVAIGTGTVLLNPDGSCTMSDGTSFSAPIVTGLVACLWQALPEMTNLGLLDIIRKSGNRYKRPNEYMGYGIPNFQKALNYGNN